MSYLEELLPKFRKGAKIRRSNWPDGHCVKLDTNKEYTVDNNNKIYTIYAEELLADNWEFYQEPDWDFIIKNKCLCWFWDEHNEKMKKAGILAYYDNNHFKRYIGDTCAVHWFEHCRPVSKDEVTFYEERNDNR